MEWFSVILSICSALSGRTDYPTRSVAQAIAVSTSDLREAATLAVTAWGESRFLSRPGRGDGGKSCGAMQVRARDAADCSALEKDLAMSMRRALWVMREGARICPAFPLAPYAGGCGVKRAQAISLSRENDASSLVAWIENDWED